MFRAMRRKRQLLPAGECLDILERNTSGVLAVSGDENYPYAVPLSNVYQDGKLYFHCARSGHKLDAVRRNKKVSFCVIDQDEVVAEEYTSYFRSVIVFGKMRILKEEQEMRNAVEKLAVKYAPGDSDENRKKAIEREWNALCILEMNVEHMTGKEAIELVKRKSMYARDGCGTE